MQPARPSLSRGHYTGYGAANLGKVAVEVTLQLYLFDFYTRILGLSPLLAGGAFAVAILWDAASDVVLSYALAAVRRRGWTYAGVLFGGSVVLGAATALLFTPLTDGSQAGLFLQLLVAYLLLNTGMTLLDLPHSSLSAELSHAPDERNRLLAARMGFGIAGLALGSILPGLLLGEGTAAESRTLASWVLAGVAVVTAGITAVTVFRREKAQTAAHRPARPGLADLGRVFRNRGFRRILAAGSVAAVGRTVNAALALLYYRIALGLGEDEVTRVIFPVFTASIILSIPMWIALSRRFGKTAPAWTAVGTLGLMGCIAYPLLPAEQLTGPVLISILGGVLCGSVFLVESLITDVIDADEEASGVRKEALFFAVWKSALKVARALSFVGLGAGLHLGGLGAGAENPPAGTVVFLFGPGVGACFIAVAWFLRGLRVAREVREEQIGSLPTRQVDAAGG
jgi:GPH family glycoside/pentoside/hexuronide:cation symporter